jgi:hypothetical protein
MNVVAMRIVFGIRCGKWHNFEGAWGGWGGTQRWPTRESYVANTSEFEYLFTRLGSLFELFIFLGCRVLAGCNGLMCPPKGSL